MLDKLPNKIDSIKQKNYKDTLPDTAIINLKYKNNLNVLIKNSWISPTKVRLIKIKFEKGTIYYDENESLYKIKIFKKIKKTNSFKYNLEIPEIDLNEPLAKLVSYIGRSINKIRNYLFENKFNEKVTRLLESINNK